MEISSTTITAALGLVTSIASYLFGRRQHVDKLRVEQALPRAERIAVLVQEIRGTQVSLAEWWRLNFRHLDQEQAFDAFERHELYDSTRKRILQLGERRGELGDAIRVARTYLNATDLDRIESFLKLGHFEFSHDGLGGVIFTGYWRGFWSNLLDEQKERQRETLYEKIKSRFGRMHQLGWSFF